MSKLTDSCAPTNAVQNLSSTYGQSNSLIRSGVERQIDQLLPSSSAGDALSREYLAHLTRQTAAPATFNLRELASAPQSRTSGHWANEFSKNYKTTVADKWAGEMAAKNRFDMRSIGAQLPSKWADEFAAQQAAPNSHKWANEFDQHPGGQQWANEFENWLSDRQVPLQNTRAGAQFGATTGNIADQWADEYSQQMNKSKDEILEAEFDSMFRGALTEYENYNPLDELPTEYEFSQANPHLSEDQLMERASERLQEGNTSEAVLYYEAAVQRNPHDADAWCRLGLSHAENEHDVAAISAFRKSLEIDGAQRDALLGFAVSLANESFDNEALTQLEKWINVYRGGGTTTESSPSGAFHQSYIDPSRFEKVEMAYLAAARSQHNGVDPELQNALGVLYNLNRNFDRAVDSIKAAIARSPNDPRLWNRLGATLANGDRTPEAIEAYRNALTLFPAYVRARYNLGISCMHLNCHREAANHFIDALHIQKGSTENSSIWSTLRSAIIRINGADSGLLDALNAHNLDALQQILQSMKVP